ncbi:hypothetical protein, partial [Microbacterium sp. MYb64]|uniref:hypothetical protein n=1 Tax=Microbacterium sp. MYb64 TaxID=1848691 RepID=UPI0015E3927E
MTEQFFKAVRHDYGSFHRPDFKYGPVGTTVTHPDPVQGSEDASEYISVATVATDCTGFYWRVNGKDSRLLVVEPVGEVWTPHADSMPNKRAVATVRVVGELPISAAFGTNGEQVAAFLALLPYLTGAQWAAAWDAARAAAWDAARDAARAAAWDAARDA